MSEISTICAKCGGEIRKISLSTMTLEQCESCKGIFLEREKLKNALIRRFESEVLEISKNKKILDEKVIPCPRCSVTMEKKRARVGKRPLLDICPSCRGIWFDEGELNEFNKAKKPAIEISSGVLSAIIFVSGVAAVFLITAEFCK